MVCTKIQAIAKVSEIDNGVILTIGAGDIDLLINPITEALNKKVKNK
jgi:hypothetical protein